MPSRDADLLLDDIKTAHARIERYVSGLGRAEFLQDEKTIDAAVRNLEIIGEAVRWLPQQFKEQHTSVPWSQIAGLRNRHRARLLRSFQKKTNELVQRHIGAVMAEPEKSFVTIDRATIETIKQREEGKATKVINLIKSIQKAAEENSNLT